jgi:hypothetical protein
MILAMDEIPKIIISFAVTFLGAFFASRLAIDKYRHEKLWEARYDLYRRMLQSLAALDSHASYAIDVECMGIDTISKSAPRLWLDIEAEQRNLEAQLAEAQLVLPVAVVDAIGEVLKTVRGAKMEYEEVPIICWDSTGDDIRDTIAGCYDHIRVASHKAVLVIKGQGRRDLKSN